METVIEEVSFLPVKPSPKGLIGFSSCLFNRSLSLNSIAVYSTTAGDIRLLFPDKVLQNGKKVNIFYPIDSETYESLRMAIKNKIKSVSEKVTKGDKADETLSNDIHN
jgi:DNA-binding cell septation regulator SpoVG